MRFILASGSIQKFDNLREDYQRLKSVNLNTEPSLIGVPTFFGGTDVKTRHKQIVFLEKIKGALQNYLLAEKDLDTAEKWQANLMGSRIMIVASLSIKAEIEASYRKTKNANKSQLHSLIDQYLGITSENFLNEHDKKICFQTAYQLTKEPTAFHYINAGLRKIGQQELSYDSWSNFAQFVSKEYKKDPAPKIADNPYPVTTFIKPIFERAFFYAGASIGWVAGEMISQSVIAETPRRKATALVGSLLLMGVTGPTGVAFLAPTIATRLIHSFCTISLGDLSGRVMSVAGQGVAVVAGLPFDLTYNLIKTAGNYYYGPAVDFAPIDGIRIADAVIVIKGHPMQFNLVHQHQLPKEQQRLQMTKDGKILMDGKAVKTKEVIDEFTKKLKQLPAPKIEEVTEGMDAEFAEFEMPSP